MCPKGLSVKTMLDAPSAPDCGRNDKFGFVVVVHLLLSVSWIITGEFTAREWREINTSICDNDAIAGKTAARCRIAECAAASARREIT